MKMLAEIIKENDEEIWNYVSLTISQAIHLLLMNVI